MAFVRFISKPFGISSFASIYQQVVVGALPYGVSIKGWVTVFGFTKISVGINILKVYISLK